MRQIKTVLITVALVLATSKAALACECLAPKRLVDPKSHGIVATARVVSVQPDLEHGRIAMEVEITEGFLNTKTGERVVIYTDYSDCRYELKQDEEYVVSSYRDESGRQEIDVCNTVPLNSAIGQGTLAQIRKETKRKR